MAQRVCVLLAAAGLDGHVRGAEVKARSVRDTGRHAIDLDVLGMRALGLHDTLSAIMVDRIEHSVTARDTH